MRSPTGHLSRLDSVEVTKAMSALQMCWVPGGSLLGTGIPIVTGAVQRAPRYIPVAICVFEVYQPPSCHNSLSKGTGA